MAENGDNTRKKRRNRVPISCFSCRAHKTKCDGIRPVCSTCAHSGQQCTFVERGISSSGRVMVNEVYLRGLEKRVQALEKSTATPNTNGTAVAPLPPAPYSLQEQQSAVQPGVVVVDANVSIGGVSFTQSVLNNVHGHENVQAQSMMADGHVRAMQSLLTQEDLYSIPENALEVLDRYFTCRNILTPIFHVPSARPMFVAALHCLPEERPQHRSAFILLNMIFALCTSHWLVDLDANPRAARRYYDIAIALLQPTLLRGWTLEHIQALLLAARYLQGTSCGDECWNVLGLAIRIAYGLRLHQDSPETDPPPLRETKRRVWYAAYTLDMHWAMVYQRPPATRTADFSVPVPEDLDDDCIQNDRILYPTPKRPSSTSFFLEVIKLYRIVEKVLGRLSENKVGGLETAELVMTLDEEYQKWLRERPTHLTLDITDAKEPPWILALRGNMVRILIHRQSLKVTLNKLSKTERNQDSIISYVLQFSRKTCVDTAMESIDIVALRHAQTKKTMGLDFFNIYYLFNAVIVLVSHIVDPANFHDRPVLEKVDKALRMISSMSSNHSFAQWAYSFLQQMLGYMHRTMESRQSNSTTAFLNASIPPVEETTALPTAMNGGSEGLQDLYSLFGFAQGLTENLETQLGFINLKDLPESLWTFNDDAVFDGFSQWM